MSQRHELLNATDEEIEDALVYADTMALRGLVYQLTGDESIAETKVTSTELGFLVGVRAVTDPADAALLRAKAADLLKAYRDAGAGEMPFGPPERLQKALSLAVGVPVPDRDIALWTEQLGLDPWARSLEWPAQPEPERLRDFHVLVIGAGMGGVNTAIHLTRAGIPHTVVEKNPAIGGTWYENRYPGARVDTPSRGYTHCYGVDYHYPYPFCPQSENESYINWAAERFEVGKDFEYDTEVKSVIWDESARLWEVQAVGPAGPRTWRVNAVISAVGFLARPNVPDIPGADEFAGEAFHTARWPAGLDVTGKRVAVIGSGCSGYQLFPEVTKVASQAYLFQRTPSWVYETPGYLSPFPPQVNWLDRNFPYYSNFLRLRAGWLFGPEILGKAFTKDPETTERITAQRLAFMRSKLGEHPELLEKMRPANPPMSSRPVLVDIEYSVYDALLEDHTALVTEDIQRISRDGIVTTDGVEHAVDVIVYATGFKANDFLWPMEIRGRDGITPEQLWEKDGARAYLGTLMPGFPNLFVIYGPNSNPTGGLGVAEMEELENRFAMRCIAELILTARSTVEVTHDAYVRYNAELDQAEGSKIYSGAPVKNYYTNEHGRSAANCPFDGRQMWDWYRDPSGNHAPSPDRTWNPQSRVRPYFGEDLVIE
jgi:4-hydroxyacetophenone monooxygenase